MHWVSIVQLRSPWLGSAQIFDVSGKGWMQASLALTSHIWSAVQNRGHCEAGMQALPSAPKLQQSSPWTTSQSLSVAQSFKQALAQKPWLVCVPPPPPLLQPRTAVSTKTAPSEYTRDNFMGVTFDQIELERKKDGDGDHRHDGGRT